GKMLFAQPKEAGFSFSHDINSPLASLSIVGNLIRTPDPAVKEKALCALNNLNASVENQGQIKMYINEVCRETVSHCCNSFLQQAGLNLLISMTVINNMLAKSVSDLKFPLISEGSGCAEVQERKQTGSPRHPGLLNGYLEQNGTESTPNPLGERTLVFSVKESAVGATEDPALANQHLMG
ncbi:hypothetical protein HPG69_002668, partial [Diceros bicornis minor]